MQLIDLLKIKKVSKRNIPDKLNDELSNIDQTFKLFLSDLQSIRKNIDFLNLTKEEKEILEKYVLNDLNRFNQKVSLVRNKIFSNNFNFNQKYSTRPTYTEKGVHYALDTLGVISLMPKTKLIDIKNLADILGYCIFQENCFSQKNNAKNKSVLPEVSALLKTKGYKIFYLSPIQSFDYYKYLKEGNDASYSYWGEHESVFNSLFLASNVLKDLYSEIEAIKGETQDLRNAVHAESKQREALHKQFSNYVQKMNSTIKRIERSLNYFVSIENKKRHEAFIVARDKALAHNEKYKNKRFETVVEQIVVDKKTGKKTDLTVEELPYMLGFDDDFNIIERSYTIDHFVTVPTKTNYLDESHYETFNIAKFLETKKLTPKIKEEMKNTVLSNILQNYMMIAIKEDIHINDEQEAIILANWGDGINPDVMTILCNQQTN